MSVVINILAITVVGLLLVPTLSFYTYVAISRICASGFASASGVQSGESAAGVHAA